MHAKCIVLVDANNFFVSCERSINPALADKPVVVLSNNDANVIARSEEAKALGIRMGEVFYKNRTKYDQWGVTYLSSNYALYSAKSKQLISILKRFSPALEYYSIDEAWLDLTDCTVDCHELRSLILTEAGIPCSFGIGRNKTEAKLAVRMAKHQPKTNGVFELSTHHLHDAILTRTPIDELWGISRGNAKRLRKLGIETAADLNKADPITIQRATNVNVVKIVYELRGIFCFELQAKPPMPKMFSASLSFSISNMQLIDMLQAAAVYTARAASRMRQVGMAARRMMVLLSTNRYSRYETFSVDHGEALLPGYSLFTPDLIDVAQAIVSRCFSPTKQYHKITIILHDLSPVTAIQTTLFEQQDWARQTILMAFVDLLNSQNGQGSFLFEKELGSLRWKSRRNFLSKPDLRHIPIDAEVRDMSPICKLGTDPGLVELLDNVQATSSK